MDNENSTNKPGVLYVVATPIGNRDDITMRALKVLDKVDLIAAEDTRHTGKLLTHHHIEGHLMSYHEHNEIERTPNFIHKLKTGSSIALVSDAGTPSVSDPGYRLVKEAIVNDITVIPVPGASAIVTALSAAGLPTDAFVFMGFPAKKKARRLKQLQTLAAEKRTIVFFESPKRILAFLDEIKTIMGDRYGVLCREMTKIHEEFIRGTVAEIISALGARSAVKGECTFLLSGRIEEEKPPLAVIRNELTKALQGSDEALSQIAKSVAKKFGLPKSMVYDEALKLKDKSKDTRRKT
jgi:16S rRNA (cytidine1402-2'-O)-methyltransferase